MKSTLELKKTTGSPDYYSAVSSFLTYLPFLVLVTMIFLAASQSCEKVRKSQGLIALHRGCQLYLQQQLLVHVTEMLSPRLGEAVEAAGCRTVCQNPCWANPLVGLVRETGKKRLWAG